MAGKIKISIDENIYDDYSNIVTINFSTGEVSFMFGRYLQGVFNEDGDSNAVMRTNIVMSPQSAALFLRAFTGSFAEYEKINGKVYIPNEDMQFVLLGDENVPN